MTTSTGQVGSAVREPTVPLGAAPPAGRRAERLVRWSRVVGDVGALLLGLTAAQGLEQTLTRGGLAQPLGPVTLFDSLAIVAWLALFANLGLYDSRRLVNGADEFKMVLEGVAIGTVVAVFVAFLLKVPTQRSWVLVTWLGCTVAVLLTRFAYGQYLRAMHRSGLLVQRLLIVGAGREGRDVCRAIQRGTSLGFRVVGFLDDRQAGPAGAGLPVVLGGSAALRQVVASHRVDAVLVAGGSVADETAERVYRDLQELPVDLHLTTGILGIAAGRVAVQRFNDVPVLGLRRVALASHQQLLKRAFDMTVAGVLLAALAPLLLACALAVRLSSAGPVLFRQRRVGRDGRVFWMHKFRSMVVDAETRLPDLRPHADTDGPVFKLRRDPRVTAVGRVLRAWSLDELPQLLDVLRGDMSLVGPRPPLPSEVADYDGFTRNRLRVKPGMTGLWQVSGRHTLSFDDYVRYDLFYVDNWSLTMDLFLILRTIPAVLGRSGA
jgi:exopolysaccharide biosynthesis polyprenyl glycosylphosphotransferase